MISSILDPACTGCNGLEVLVAMTPSATLDALVEGLLNLDCKVYPAQSPEDAFAKLQFHAFHLVIVEENYSLEMIGLLANLPTVIRRNIFYTLIGDSLETGNMLQSYVLSANLVVNRADAADAKFPQFICNCFLDNNRFYRPFYYAQQSVTSAKNS